MIFLVSKDDFQPRQLVGSDACQQLWCGGAVVQVRCCDDNRHQQSQRIHEQMTLAAFDFLPAIITAIRPADLCRFDGLGVDANGARCGFTTFPNAKPLEPRSKANDLAQWRTRLSGQNVDGSLGIVRRERVRLISSGTVEADPELGFRKAVAVRDPDGHAIEIVEP